MKQQIIIRDLDSLKKCIQSKLENHPVLCIIIDGPCAAGKTTLAKKLSSEFYAPIIAMDHFFLRPEQRSLARMQEIGGNIDYERFEKEILSNLQTSKSFTYLPYNCQRQAYEKAITISYPSLLIVEGVYSQHPNFHYPHCLTIFLTINSQTQHQRLMERNPNLITRFSNEWIPKENEYFTHFNIHQQADILLATNNSIKEETNYAKETI